jgi:hypothetical protein
MSRKWIGLGVFAACTLALSACGVFGDSAPTERDTDAARRADDPYHTNPLYNPNVPAALPNINEIGDGSAPGLFSALFGKNKKAGGGDTGGGGGVSVNTYLWHGSLDTVSFMPVASADPFGGTIISDWYSPAETPNERFKVNVFILSRELRADGVRATVFRQKKDASGQWVDAPIDPKTGQDLENAILARARQLRLSTAQK